MLGPGKRIMLQPKGGQQHHGRYQLAGWPGKSRVPGVTRYGRSVVLLEGGGDHFGLHNFAILRPPKALACATCGNMS